MSALFLDLAIWVALLAVAVGLLSVMLMAHQEKKQRHRRIQQRLSHGMVAASDELFAEEKQENWLQLMLLRAGMQVNPLVVVLVILLVALGAFMATLRMGPLAGLMVVGVACLVLWGVWWRRVQSRRLLILSELPGIMEGAVRGLDAGLSLEQAFVEVLEGAPDIYRPLAFRVKTAAESGRDFSGFFADFGNLYRVPSLIMVSIGLTTSRRFGASVRPILLQTAQSLRTQDQLRRDFLAMTSETRFSAVFFAAIPVLLGVGLMAFVPMYRETLLETDSGHTMLMFSGGMVILGSFWLYRMVQGVGRG